MLRLLTEWLDRSRILRDERRLRQHDTAHARQQVADRIKAGERALANGDHPAALQIWQEARAQYPDLTMASPDGLQLLLALNQFGIAESLMQEGVKRFPRNPFYLESTAIVAKRRGDHAEAVRRYAVLRKKFPRIENGYTRAVDSLIELGRLDEADRILGTIAARSNTLPITTRHARLAMTRKDWPTALQRWQNVRHETATVGSARCLREMRRFDEAEQLLTDAIRRARHGTINFRMELARLAEARADWPEAARIWDDLRRSAPSRHESYRHASLALAKCGREPEAELVLHEATQRFPAEPQFWIDYANAAKRRGDAEAAAARWQQLRVNCPDHPRA